MKSKSGPAESRRLGEQTRQATALRQIRESAQSMVVEGKVEEAFDLLVSALDAVLKKTRELELTVLDTQAIFQTDPNVQLDALEDGPALVEGQ